MKIVKSYAEINQKIKNRQAVVMTAEEIKSFIREQGIKSVLEKVDVVTTGTFGAMCSSGAFLNFGHTDPPLKMEKVKINDVPAYGGLAAVDAYIGATERSQKSNGHYGGGHVIEDMVAGKNLVLEAEGKPTDCYPLDSIVTEFTLKDLNQAVLLNPRNAYQRYNAAANSTDRIIYTYMGRLLPRLGNVTYSGAGELSPLNNDPNFLAIGLGTRIFLGGGVGYVIDSGSQHSPETGFANLMVKGDLKLMRPEYLRGAYVYGYGCTLFVGIGVPIPLLNEEIARSVAITDDELRVNIVDYGIPRLKRPILRTGVTYRELKSGQVEIEGKPVPTGSLSSLFMARKIANELKNWILSGNFILTEAVEPIPKIGKAKQLAVRTPKKSQPPTVTNQKHSKEIQIDHSRCILCELCIAQCPEKAIYLNENNQITIDQAKCNLCRICTKVCSVGCLE
ncbi:MAG TPA: homocysteine biosynthesis protein [Candidatus Marinimicrobia bacterium]|nr:homocysteine biosynthesis protein [Candidatus Neomarinimicrobiota bacterium]